MMSARTPSTSTGSTSRTRRSSSCSRSSPTAGREEIAELERQVAEEPFRRAAQKTLAADVTTLVHGAERDGSGAGGLRGAVRQGRPVRALDARTLADATGELPGAEVSVGHVRRRRAGGGRTGGVAQRRAPGDRRRRGLAQQRQDRRPGGTAGGGRLPVRPGRAVSGAVASRSRQAAAPAEPPASWPAPEEGPPEGVGPLRISSITGPQAADLRICLLPGDPSTVLFVSPTGRNGHHRASHHREAGRSRGRLHQHEAVSTASGTAPSARVGLSSTAAVQLHRVDLEAGRAASKLEWLPRTQRLTAKRTVRVRILRTQQRVKNRCQLPRLGVAACRVCWPGGWSLRTKILWLTMNDQFFAGCSTSASVMTLFGVQFCRAPFGVRGV